MHTVLQVGVAVSVVTLILVFWDCAVYEGGRGRRGGGEGGGGEGGRERERENLKLYTIYRYSF